MLLLLLLSGCLVSLSDLPVLCQAGQVPYSAAAPDIPISSRDRLYLSDQTSNAVSVLDPATNTLLGVIQLGSNKLPETLSAVYRGQSLVHGMGFSPDGATLAVVAVASNAVVLVDTRNNTVKHISYVGRAPHEAMWTPDGSELWVTVRGEDYIQVLDGRTYEPKRQVKTPNGPGMTIFSPSGNYAYICSSFTAETVVVDTASYAVVGRIKQVSPFCPNIAATPDGSQVWFTLKDTGRVQVFNGRPPFQPLAVLETGPITNHVNFAKGRAYVTVGGQRAVKVFSTDSPQPKLLATIADVGDNPHGLWPSGDGTRLYVGLQLGNAVAVIDTSGEPAAHKVLQRIDVGAQAPMALMYVPQAIPAAGAGAGAAAASASPADANLVPAAVARKAAKALHVSMVPTGARSAVATSVAVNNQGFTDSLEAAVTGLQPGKLYVLALADTQEGSGEVEPLASFVGGKDGAASVAVLGPFRSMLMGRSSQQKSSSSSNLKQARFLVVAELVGSGDDSRVGGLVQVQQAEM